MDIKGVIFDYGGTIDSRGDHWSEIIWDGWFRAGATFSREAFRDSGHDATGAMADIAARYCYDRARECVEESRSVIEAVTDRVPAVLVSNFYGNIGAVLADFGLGHLFRAVIESAVVGVRKPDPRIFMLGVDALGLRPGEVLVVGDSLKKDILPAESVGCRTAWLKGKGWTAEEDRATPPSQIGRLADILRLI